MDNGGLCFLIVLVVSFALVVFGLIEIMSKQRANEVATDVPSRQLRGFGWLILAQIILAVGSALCVGTTMGGWSGVKNVLYRGTRAGGIGQ